MDRAPRLADPRLALITLLGFASGLPLLLTAFTLGQWLTESRVPLALIGLTANVGIAYSLKFLWAPLMDAASPPPPFGRLGRRRGWLFATQAALLAAAVALALSNPARAALATIALAALVAFCSASQDIMIDAWRIETFPPRLQGAAMAGYVWGYRVAMLVSGSGAIALASFWGWHGSLLAMAALTLLGPAATLLAAEPHAGARLRPLRGWRREVAQALRAPLADMLARPGAPAILGFIVLFRLGEAMAGTMLPPFYHALGFDRAAVALAAGPVSLAATLAGAALGGLLVARLGVARALLLTGAVQTVSMAMYVVLAYAAGSHATLIATAVIESGAGGLSDAAFLTYLSGLCNPAFTATQYALLSSLAALAWRTLGGLSGVLAATLGWKGYFTLTAFAALPAMGLMLYLLRRHPPAEQPAAAG